MFDTKVVTSYANGTMIQMDANDALNFLVGLSITVINTVRDTIKEENKFGNKITKSSDHDVMHLIEYYNSGVPEAIYSCILQTNADILLKFVQDVVLMKLQEDCIYFIIGQSMEMVQLLMICLLKLSKMYISIIWYMEMITIKETRVIILIGIMKSLWI